MRFGIILLTSLLVPWLVAAETPHWPASLQNLFSQGGHGVTYQGADDTRNYYHHFWNPQNPEKPPLIIITGLEDYPQMWLPTVQGFLDFGFSHVFIVELRGQGFSERPSGQNIIHLFDINNYYQDLASAFWAIAEHIEKETGRGPKLRPLVIAHSTGALVLLNSLPLIAEKTPQLLPARVSFWSPLFQMKVSPLLNNSLVRPLIRTFQKVHDRWRGPFVARRFQLQDFKNNVVTSDPQKYGIMQTYRSQGNIATDGVSLKWALDMIEATAKPDTGFINKQKIPVQILLAAHDQVVNNQWELHFSQQDRHVLAGAEHALHFERDEIFNKALKFTRQFFAREGTP